MIVSGSVCLASCAVYAGPRPVRLGVRIGGKGACPQNSRGLSAPVSSVPEVGLNPNYSLLVIPSKVLKGGPPMRAAPPKVLFLPVCVPYLLCPQLPSEGASSPQTESDTRLKG